MTCCDAQQCEGWSLRSSAILLPIPQRMNADSNGLCKLSLGEVDKLPESGNVSTRFKLTLHQSAANSRWDRSCELLLSYFGNFSHFVAPSILQIMSLDKAGGRL